MAGGVVPPGRLVGLDVARCLALLGMMATHVVGKRTPDGDLTWAYALAGGRASALFAVLAGVSVALMSGRTEPGSIRGRERWSVAAGLAARAVLIALFGLALGGLGSGLAVILTYYGVLFALGIPFLVLRSRSLALLAAGWLVTAPVVSHLLQPRLPERGWDSPRFADLAEPGQLLSELVVTGYYPVLPWLAYLLAGMAIGRVDLRSPRVGALVAGGGAALAVAAVGLSRWFTAQAGVRDALGFGGSDHDALLNLLADGMAGTPPPEGAWHWLLVVAPHSATPFDLAHTIGCAAAVIGVCLLVVALAPRAAEQGLAVFFGAGTMTLTLYSLHVVMRTPELWPAEEPGTLVWHVLVVLGIGALTVAIGRRGPLETIAGGPARILRER